MLFEMRNEPGDDLLFDSFYGTREDFCGLITRASSALLDFVVSDEHTSFLDLFLEAIKRCLEYLGLDAIFLEFIPNIIF